MVNRNVVSTENKGMRTHKNSKPTTFKVLQRETTVYQYFVELKDDALTDQGFFDLAKVPDLRISNAGLYLSNLRLNNSLSQEDITNVIDVSIKAVSAWEHGRNRIPLQSLVKIAEAFGVSRDTIYSLIDLGILKTKSKIPVNFEKVSNIIQYFSPYIDDGKARITLLRCCPKDTITKIRETLNINLISRRYNRKMINCKELSNFLTTFFRYSKVPKIHPPLTSEVKCWHDDGIDLRRAIIIPSLQSDGGMRHASLYSLRFFGNNKVLHDYFVDAMYYEYNELPTSYFASCFDTEYTRTSTKELVDEVMKVAGNSKTSPANGQTVEDYLKEPQPHLDYLMNASESEQQIALRIWASTEGSPYVYRSTGNVYPRLKIACAHPDLAKQLQKIAERFSINFSVNHSKEYWSGVAGLSTSGISPCINFLKFGGFIKGTKISKISNYHEGIDKDILLLGILEYKKRELENSRLRNLPIQQVHQKINEIIENRYYRSADYYINCFS